MLKHHARRLARRLFTLFVLAAALAALSFNPPGQKAQFIPPCSACEYTFNNCLANCEALGEAYEFACHSQCANRYNNCISNCR